MTEPRPHEETHAPSPEPVEPLEHDEEIAAAFQYILDRKKWRPSRLAREAGLSPGVVHQVVTGQSTNTATLRRLCQGLGIELWLFWFIAEHLAHASVPSRTEDQAEAYRTIIAGVEQLLKESVMSEPTTYQPADLPAGSPRGISR